MTLQGNFIDFIIAFFSGVVISFSPCVYPLIPVILGFVGVKASSSQGFKGLFFSLVYVLGLAITYSVLGLIAAFSGRLFGQLASNPVSFLIIGNICIIIGLSFLEVINISFTKINLQSKIRMTGSVLSVFLFGLVSGLVVGPCTAPALGTILVYVAGKQNIIYGASLLFIFAFGTGFSLVLAGTFSAVIFNLLSKSVVWSVRLKKLAGFILIIIGEYFLVKAGELMW